MSDTPTLPAGSAASAKRIVTSFWEHVCAGEDHLTATLQQHVAAHARWQVSAPIEETHGGAVARDLFVPLLRALRPTDVHWHAVLEGTWDGATWATGTGYLECRPAAPWLGIPPAAAGLPLRFGVFHRLVDGRIDDTMLLFDVLDLAHRAGVPNLPGRYDLDRVPAARPTDGPSADTAGTSTLELVEAMLFDGLASFDGIDLGSMDLDRYWHPDMRWYGPGGIGSTVGIAGFQDIHQRPFLQAFPDRSGGQRDVRLGEGHLAAFGGYPSMRCTHTGAPYLGVPARGDRATIRVMDWWQREDTRLRDNWVLIDIPHLLAQFGRPLFVGGEIRPSGVAHGPSGNGHRESKENPS